jgi:hypothetical protein
MPLDEVALKGELDADAANQAQKAGYDNAYYQALLEVAKGSLERSRLAADVVQKAAAAIGTLYAAVLGVSFSVSNHRLPARGIIPGIFLGLAIALSTAYVAYIGRPSDVQLDPLHTSPPVRLQRHVNNFFRIITDTVQRRVYWLRASVIALGIGVLLLPIPFITFGTGAAVTAASQYPWPSPQPASTDREGTLEAIVFKAQVDEVAALRQQARLEQSEPDLVGWLIATAFGLLLVFGIPFGSQVRWPRRN